MQEWQRGGIVMRFADLCSVTKLEPGGGMRLLRDDQAAIIGAFLSAWAGEPNQRALRSDADR